MLPLPLFDPKQLAPGVAPTFFPVITRPFVPKPLPARPRPYQREGFNAVMRALARGQRRPLVELPTGAGKTYLMGLLTNALLRQVNGQGHVVFLVPWLELVEQGEADFLTFFDASDIGVIQGERNEMGRRITIASVATLARPERLRDFLRSLTYPLISILVDEAHRGLCESIQTICEALDPHGEVDIIGMTATPYRTDERSLITVFTSGIVYSRSFIDLVLAGYLTNVIAEDVVVDTDFSSEEIRQLLASAQLSEDQLDDDAHLRPLLAKMINTRRFAQITDRWLARTGGTRKTLLFAQSVRAAYAWRKYLQERGIVAEVVTGSMTKAQRKPIMDRFVPGGDIQVLVNVRVFSTGINLPYVSSIIIDAVLSLGPFIQCVGRGMRLYEGKEDCLLFNATNQRHSLMTMGRLIGRVDASRPVNVRAEAIRQLADQANLSPKTIRDLPLPEVWQQAEVRLRDIFTGDGWVLHPETQEATKDFGPLGMLRARQYPSGYLIWHVSTRGGRSQILAREHLALRAALALGQQHMTRLQMQERLRRGARNGTRDPVVREQLGQPITEKQWQYLCQRQIPGVPKVWEEACRLKMTQEAFYFAENFLRVYKKRYAPGVGSLIYDQQQRRMRISRGKPQPPKK